ncbi:MAG: HDOD domain-containing protein [Planctomycetes bacterium]|nr:HDOD domain-containing protein [Planctomycetota bacterium]
MPSLEERIYEYINRMPSLSPTVVKVNELANDINASPRDLVKVIRMDPVLTAKVLKLINSAYFAMSNDITSLERALILLGVNTVKNLALSTAVISTMSKPDVDKSVDMDAIWLHSLAVGCAAKDLAMAKGMPKNTLEEYFITGLLHDIGEILVMQYMPETYRQIVERMAENCCGALAAEQEVLELCHTEIGGLIADKWRLTGALTESIRDHHAPDPESPNAPTVCIVHVADYLSQQRGFIYSGEQVHPGVSEDVWAKLGLDEARCTEAVAHLNDELDKAKVFLRTARG